MELQTTNASTPRRSIAKRIFRRIVRCLIGVCGLLLLAVILLVFGWLIFLCWLYDRRSASRTHQPIAESLRVMMGKCLIRN